MGINVKQRKLLWGKSGNKCAICKAKLMLDGKRADETSIVGIECHIRSLKPNGPRHDNHYPLGQIDDYKNLILLCGVHHKIIDDLCNEYTTDNLIKIKTDHEEWVAQQLSPESKLIHPKVVRVKENIPTHLLQMTSGKQLAYLINGCAAMSYCYDDTFSKQEVSLTSDFLQEIQDYVDVYTELDISIRIESEMLLNDYIEKLDKKNIWVFAMIENRIITGGNNSDEIFPVLIIQLLFKDNSDIIKVETR
jgi:hypothetical protein